MLNLLNSFSFKSVTPFQTKFKAPVKKNKKSLHQYSLLLNDTDIASVYEEHIFTRIPKQESSFSSDKILHDDTYSTIKTPMSTTLQESASAIKVQTHSQPNTPCSQIIPFHDTSSFKNKNFCFFLPDDYSLELKTLQQQQAQDPVLRNV